jgi:hypothetical protein
MFGQILETLGSFLWSILRYLLIDILIEIVIRGLGAGLLKLSKIITGGRYPAGQISEQTERLKIGSGIAAALLLFMVWLSVAGLLL